MPQKIKMTIPALRQKKAAGEKIAMLTAYDYPGAKCVDEAGADVILVGDSLAMTVLGYPDTVSVTMDEMLHHCKAVARGAKHAFLVGDMPFMSYQIDAEEAKRNAGRLLKEGRMDAVKLEGGSRIVATIRAIVDAGIAVMGHLGLTPQSATQLGGYKVQGKNADRAAELYQDALLLEEAGCFALVLEAVPAPVAQAITQKLRIPTIGIGAGSGCDGQVLVYHDLLGMFKDFTPQFVKKYAELGDEIVAALRRYCDEVRSGKFPGPEHAFKMDAGELAQFQKHIAQIEKLAL